MDLQTVDRDQVELLCFSYSGSKLDLILHTF